MQILSFINCKFEALACSLCACLWLMGLYQCNVRVDSIFRFFYAPDFLRWFSMSLLYIFISSLARSLGLSFVFIFLPFLEYDIIRIKPNWKYASDHFYYEFFPSPFSSSFCSISLSLSLSFCRLVWRFHVPCKHVRKKERYFDHTKFAEMNESTRSCFLQKDKNQIILNI